MDLKSPSTSKPGDRYDSWKQTLTGSKAPSPSKKTVSVANRIYMNSKIDKVLESSFTRGKDEQLYAIDPINRTLV